MPEGDDVCAVKAENNGRRNFTLISRTSTAGDLPACGIDHLRRKEMLGSILRLVIKSVMRNRTV
jgi:hypothetical protein